MKTGKKNSILVISLLLGFVLSGCEKPDDSTKDKSGNNQGWNADEVISDINEKASELTKEISTESEEIARAVSEKVGELLKDSTDSLPAKEVKKLSQFEYRVFEMPVDSSNEDFESELNALGQERWECFDVKPLVSEEEGTGSFLFFCKRRPFTPLKFVPSGLALPLGLGNKGE